MSSFFWAWHKNLRSVKTNATPEHLWKVHPKVPKLPSPDGGVREGRCLKIRRHYTYSPPNFPRNKIFTFLGYFVFRHNIPIVLILVYCIYFRFRCDMRLGTAYKQFQWKHFFMALSAWFLLPDAFVVPVRPVVLQPRDGAHRKCGIAPERGCGH